MRIVPLFFRHEDPRGSSRLGLLSSAVVAGLLLSLGCGGSAPPPAVPGQGTGSASAESLPSGVAVPELDSNSHNEVAVAMSPAAAEFYRAGIAAYAAGDVAGAQGQFQQAVASDDNAAKAHFALGSTHDVMGETDRAINAYRRALDLAPAFAPAVEALTKTYVRDERFSAAETFLNDQRAQVGDKAALLSALAELKSAQKDSAAAQELAQRALKISPDYKPAMVVLARDHFRNRRIDLAQYTLNAILDGYGVENPARDPENAEARLLRALIYKQLSNRGAAIAELERVVQTRPDLVEARVNLAAFMLEAGNADGAVPLLEGALAYQPSNVLVHLNLGDAYRLQGRPMEALKQLEWVAKASPKLAEVHYNIGLVYLFSSGLQGITEEQAVEQAIEEFETYKKMRPRTRAGAGDDVEELLTRSRNKKSVLEALKTVPPDDFDSGAKDSTTDDASEDGTGGGDDGFDDFE